MTPDRDPAADRRGLERLISAGDGLWGDEIALYWLSRTETLLEALHDAKGETHAWALRYGSAKARCRELAGALRLVLDICQGLRVIVRNPEHEPDIDHALRILAANDYEREHES